MSVGPQQQLDASTAYAQTIQAKLVTVQQQIDAQAAADATSQQQLTDVLDNIYGRLKAMADLQQQNAAVNVAAASEAQAKLASVSQQVDRLKAQPNTQKLDFTGLDAALANVDSSADDVAGGKPAKPPAPSPPTPATS